MKRRLLDGNSDRLKKAVRLLAADQRDDVLLLTPHSLNRSEEFAVILIANTSGI